MIPGVLPDLISGAEIKPVEPDQDNTCAGKDESSPLSFPVFVHLVPASECIDMHAVTDNKNRMKKMMMAAMALALHAMLPAQSSLHGNVKDKSTGTPVVNATVTLPGNIATITDENGNFSFSHIKAAGYNVMVTAVGYKDVVAAINPAASRSVTILLERIPLLLQPVEIKGVRAGEKAPFAKNSLSKLQIEKLNLGQDLPFVLNQLPSVIINSDAGNGVGYTAFRIRGSDATRTNVTLNGIPYNDAESQGSFFVDLPDFASSVSSIQVQRGIGTSSNGAGAFGATINMSTNEFNENPYAESSNAFGSFNTWKHNIKAGTGLIDGHFTVDARLSSITSDGYIDRASSDLKSYYFSTAYFAGRSSLRFNTFSGKEKTYQAWNGVPEDKLATDRTYNSAGTEKPGEPYDNETDNYKQDHYQLFYNQEINDVFRFNIAAFLTRGQGYYEQYKAGIPFSKIGLDNQVIGDSTVSSTDLVRQLWLDNYYYGSIFSLQYQRKGTQWITGGGWTKYDGKHYGKVIWAQTGIPKDYSWYHLNARKADFNIYSKLQQRLTGHLDGFLDLQYRNVHYVLNGFRDNPDLRINEKYNFLNPKAGLTYSNGNWTGFVSYALAGKEPNRDDFEAGMEQQPKPERLHDFELGINRKGHAFNWGANIYYMLYKNQLVLTGKINDVGAYTRTNVPNSYRTGIELQADWRPAAWFNAAGNIAFSSNKVKNYTAYYDDYDNGGQRPEAFDKTDIAFSPAVVGSATLSFTPVKIWELSLLSKYVSRQYLDNTGNKARMLGAYYVQDFRTIYTVHKLVFREMSFILQVNNIFNTLYEPNGYTYGYIYGGKVVDENYYFPMAGANFMVGVNVKL